MRPEHKSSLLWGAVGALSYLVLAQGYQFWRDTFLGLGPLFGVAVLVFAVTTVSAQLLRPRLPQHTGDSGDAD